MSIKKTAHNFWTGEYDVKCHIEICPWEHGYYVEVIYAEYPDQHVLLKYFYTFQDAHSFATKLARLLNQDVPKPTAGDDD